MKSSVGLLTKEYEMYNSLILRSLGIFKRGPKRFSSPHDTHRTNSVEASLRLQGSDGVAPITNES